MSILQNNFKLLREKSGLNQAQLSLSLGFSRGVWNMYENGKSTPSLSDYFKITKYFGCEGFDLMSVDLANVNFGKNEQTEKNKQHVNSDVNFDVNFVPKKQVKTQNVQLPISVVNEGTTGNLSEGKVIAAQDKAIQALEALNAHLSQQVAVLTEQITDLKREIPIIGKPMEGQQSKSA